MLLRGTTAGEICLQDTHVNCHMAHHACMMRKPNVLALVMNAIAIRYTVGRWGLVVNDIGTLHVYLDGAGVGDSVLQARAGGVDLGRSIV